MSDSAEVIIEGGRDKVVLYTHSSGSDLPELVRAGLLTAVQHKRTDDYPYLVRILFCHILTPEELYEPLGFGISSTPAGGDRMILINVDQQTIESDDYGITRQSLRDFIYQQGDDDGEDEEDADPND